MDELRIVPCNYRVIFNPVTGHSRYWAKIYMLIREDNLETYSFWRLADCVDNQQALLDSGVKCYFSSIEVPVNDFQFSEMYKQLLDYVCVTDNY